jgi:hypothetical protein
VVEHERQVNKQRVILEALSAELNEFDTKDTVGLQHQLINIQNMDKDISAALLYLQQTQNQVRNALEKYRQAENNQRGMIELLQKNVERHRINQMTPSQQAYRNFLKDIKRLWFYRSKVEHINHPLRCFISYAWE